jgi:hypothetical protein
LLLGNHFDMIAVPYVIDAYLFLDRMLNSEDASGATSRDFAEAHGLADWFGAAIFHGMRAAGDIKINVRDLKAGGVRGWWELTDQGYLKAQSMRRMREASE